MKILITGVHGFVGANLVKALSKYHTIYGVDIVAPIKEGVIETFGWDDVPSNDSSEKGKVKRLFLGLTRLSTWQGKHMM